MTKAFGVCKPAKDGSDPCDTVWKSTSVSWVHPTIQRTRRKILISTQLRQVRARDSGGCCGRHRRQVHRPLRRTRGARCAPRGPLDMVLIARGSRPRRRDGRLRNPSRAARPCRRRCFCARAPQSCWTKLTKKQMYIQTSPSESSDDVRPPAAAGPAGPAAVVVGLAAPVELVTDEEASQTRPTPVVVAARVAAADKPAVGDPVPLDDGLSYFVHID